MKKHILFIFILTLVSFLSYASDDPVITVTSSKTLRIPGTTTSGDGVWRKVISGKVTGRIQPHTFISLSADGGLFQAPIDPSNGRFAFDVWSRRSSGGQLKLWSATQPSITTLDVDLSE